MSLTKVFRTFVAVVVSVGIAGGVGYWAFTTQNPPTTTTSSSSPVAAAPAAVSKPVADVTKIEETKAETAKTKTDKTESRPADQSAAPSTAEKKVVETKATVAAKTETKPATKPETKPIVQASATQTEVDRNGYNMFGGSPDRNMVILGEKNVPYIFSIGEEKNPKANAEHVWHEELGSRAYGGPIVSGGKVFVGTNNERPRNTRDRRKNEDGEYEPIDKGILMCFDEKTGKFLWQAVHDKLPSGQVNDWPKEGICSTPIVQGNRVYYVTNRCTVVCADVEGMANGNDGDQTERYKTPIDVDIVWEYDMIGELNVFPHNMSAASPMIVGDIIYLVTANGVDENHLNIPSIEAPSFLALDKNTGKLKWSSNIPGKNIMHGQWSNPVYAEIKGVPQVIFPGGDGWLYSFEPKTGKLIWKFDCNPKDSKYELGGTGTRNDFIGTPVEHNGKIFIGVGQDPEHFTGIGHFWCIDPSKASATNTDLSPRDSEFNPQDPKNKDSGLVWHYGGVDKRKFVPRDFAFGRTMSTATIVDDVLYIAELQGFLHCLDARTGKKYWQYDTKGAIWGSTMYVDGKIFLATESGDLYVFKHEKNPKTIDELDVQGATDERDFRKKMLEKRKEVENQYLLAKNEFDAPIRSTPVAANGKLFVMTEKSLYVFKKKS